MLKIILFGSYAKGGWVDEPFTTKGYRADFDLLIIVKNGKLCESAEHWYKAAERLRTVVVGVFQQLIDVRLGKLLPSILRDSAPGIYSGLPLRLL